jgi:hypothetical protein
MSRKIADRFWAWFGGTVEERIELIDSEAAKLLEDIKDREVRKADGDPYAKGQYSDADVRRWAVDQLRGMRNFYEPPPQNLVDLIAALVNVPARPRKSVKNREKYFEAAVYLAKHPDATISAIKRGIGYDQHRQINAWLESPEFQDRVEQERLIMRSQDLKGVVKKV